MSGSEEGKSHELVIIRRRANEDEGGHHGGVWKIAYADFMTAMMAFFLVMWLINSTDKKTLTQVATYFNPMRLTDKRPSPKGLDEPDGSEGKDSAAQKGAKKEDGDAKGREEERGRSAGRSALARKALPARDGGAGAEESRRSPALLPAKVRVRPGAGPTAIRSITVHRSEITPSEPTSGRVAGTIPSVTAPSPAPTTPAETAPAAVMPSAAEAGRKAPAEAKVAAIAQHPARDAKELKELKEFKELSESKTKPGKPRSQGSEGSRAEAKEPGKLPSVRTPRSWSRRSSWRFPSPCRALRPTSK